MVNLCHHEGKFFCTTVTVETFKSEGDVKETMYAFACIKRCGFWLNFDPVWAGRIKEGRRTPNDYKLDCWRLNTVSFLPFPDPKSVWKTPRPLAVEGSRMRKEGF